MKYAVLSFDDGRKDFYTHAFPILKKYGLPATLNVITDTLTEEDAGHITEAELLECFAGGVEIACHSADHSNDIAQIIRGTERLETILGAPKGSVGFASPDSEICAKNFAPYGALLRDGRLLYIRSGNQVRRDGYAHAGMYVLYRAVKSRTLFRWYNRRNLLHLGDGAPAKEYFYPSITCNAENSMAQVISFLQSMPEASAAIIMFHSILPQEEMERAGDKWRNGTGEFEELCGFLAREPGIRAVTQAQLHRLRREARA